MKKTFKFFICALSSVIIAFSAASCSGIFTGGRSSSSSGESSPEQASESVDHGSFYDRQLSGINVVIGKDDGNYTPTDLVTMLEEKRPSVVEIYVASGNSVSAGSGVIVGFSDSDDDGEDDVALIVTCHHVVEGTTVATVKTIYGTEYTASLIGSDPFTDIAVICVRASEDKPFDGLAKASWYDGEIKVGMDVVAIGNPLGTLGGTVTKGIVSALNRDMTVEGKKMTLIQTDAAINGGNSGGGLFNAQTGSLIGIVNSGYAAYAAEGLNFAVPASTAMEIENELLSSYGDTFGYIEGRCSVGAEFALTYESFGFSRRYYVYISSLDPYGSFAKGGLKVGDLVYSLQIGDEIIDLSTITVNTLTDLNAFVARDFSIGDDVKVSYGRYENRSYVTHEANFKISQYIYGET